MAINVEDTDRFELMTKITLILFPRHFNTLQVVGRVKRLAVHLLFKRLPIPTGNSVPKDDRVEDARRVVGMMAMGFGQRNVATLIPYKVFVIRRKQQEVPMTYSMMSGILVDEELPVVPFYRVKLVAEGGDPFSAVSDTQSRPPYKVLQGCRASA